MKQLVFIFLTLSLFGAKSFGQCPGAASQIDNETSVVVHYTVDWSNPCGDPQGDIAPGSYDCFPCPINCTLDAIVISIDGVNINVTPAANLSQSTINGVCYEVELIGTHCNYTITVREC